MDEKLCPLLKTIEGGPDFKRETFLPCLREKCAWWIEPKRVHGSDERDGFSTESIIAGGCAIARRGKGEA